MAHRLQEFIAYQKDTAQLGMNVPPKVALIQATDEATIKGREVMIKAICRRGS
ncbi:hypothetical protein [Microvirga vignae]|uniref:hypothetical protein n=1 Tax=Microvirga vignae TaxID=1225564 RepID=UPI000A6D171C|nr:hypothetical protein [Microvirga vignae]